MRDEGLRDGRSWLGFASLDQFLAIDAIRRPGKGLDAFRADWLVAANAIAEASVRNADQCLAHEPQLRASYSALREQQFFLISRDGLVGNVAGVIAVAGKRLYHCVGNGLLQFLLSLP
jgi:hypothetical protein